MTNNEIRKIYSVEHMEDDDDLIVCAECIDGDMEIIEEVDPDCTCDICGHHPLSGGVLE